MKITIDTEILDKYRMSLSEFMRLYSLRANCGDDDNDIVALRAKGFIANDTLFDGTGHFTFNQNTSGLINEIIQRSAIVTDLDKDINLFPYEKVWGIVKDMYPKGIQPGTQANWRISSKMFKQRMQYMFRQLNCIYSDTEVIDAFRQYTNANLKFMRTMGYFIYNHSRHDNTFNSDLSTVIECGIGEIINTDWTTDTI